MSNGILPVYSTKLCVKIRAILLTCRDRLLRHLHEGVLQGRAFENLLKPFLIWLINGSLLDKLQNVGQVEVITVFCIYNAMVLQQDFIGCSGICCCHLHRQSQASQQPTEDALSQYIMHGKFFTAHCSICSKHNTRSKAKAKLEELQLHVHTATWLEALHEHNTSYITKLVLLYKPGTLSDYKRRSDLLRLLYDGHMYMWEARGATSCPAVAPSGPMKASIEPPNLLGCRCPYRQHKHGSSQATWSLDSILHNVEKQRLHAWFTHARPEDSSLHWCDMQCVRTSGPSDKASQRHAYAQLLMTVSGMGMQGRRQLPELLKPMLQGHQPASSS